MQRPATLTLQLTVSQHRDTPHVHVCASWLEGQAPADIVGLPGLTDFFP
jgi:hypothetical protein